MKTVHLKYNSRKRKYIMLFFDKNGTYNVQPITKETAKIIINAFDLKYKCKKTIQNTFIREWSND